uniref:Uncharacterized protein n=1 Tax=Tetranychus urticae TaxID=32264 RepID=T1JV14_TETUR
MFVDKYFVLMFMTLCYLTKTYGGDPIYVRIIDGNQKFDLQQSLESETNFLLKARLDYEAYEGSSSNFYIEESIFSDERNRIVTTISRGFVETIEIFREFETQRILMVCFPSKYCEQNGNLRNYKFYSEDILVTSIVKNVLMMGPYRIISYFANETLATNKISRWIDTGRRYRSTQYMEMTAKFSDRYFRKLMGLKNPLKLIITEGFYRNATLFITQVEPLKKVTISKANKGIHYELTDTIGSRKNFTPVNGNLSDSELIYDYKFGIKYTLSGSNECAIELRHASDEFIFANSEYYGRDSYFPKNPVEWYSNKFMVKAEFNKLVDNVNYDFVVTTYSRSSPNWFEGFSIEQKLYSKSASNEDAFKCVYIESRMISFSDSFGVDGDLNEIVNFHDRCFKDGKNKIILDLKIVLLDKALANIHESKDELRKVLMDKLRISFLRINLIKFNFLNSHIMAKVEIFDSIVNNFGKFLRVKKLTCSINKNIFRLESKKGISYKFKIQSTLSGKIYTSSIDDCLRFQTNNANSRYVITCKTGYYLCLGIAYGDSLPEEDKNGMDCMLFDNSDRNSTKLLAEVSLREIRESYFNLNGSRFNYSDIKFAVVDVTIEDDIKSVEKKPKEEIIRQEKPKLSLTLVFFIILSIISILINIVIFVKFALGYKLSQRPNRPLGDSVSIKLNDLNN